MIILRAGLTGCLCALVNPHAIVIDPDVSPNPHKAVLRFRSDDISKVTGITFERIRVTKHIFSEGDFRLPNPMLANLYSQKVVGGIYDRSINNMDPVTRWIAPDNFHEQMIELIGKRISWGEAIKIWDYDDVIVSTLPMNEMAKMVHLDPPDTRMVSNSIFVTTLLVKNSQVHQTIYYPDEETPVYRATLEGGKLIIESIAEIAVNDVTQIQFQFGIKNAELIDLNYKQKIGKIAPIDDAVRKDFIFRLTDEHSIYSLGRTAIWKNILLDDCLKDIHQINKMIAKSKYDRALGI